MRFATDPAGPLFDGVGDTAYAMVEFDDLWTATVPGTAAARYPAVDDPDWFVSGFDTGIGELAGTAAIIDEAAGGVVLFASDPNYRAYTDGTQKILRNVLERTGEGSEDTTDATSDGEESLPAAPAPAPVQGAFLPDSLVITVEAGAANEVRAILAAQGGAPEVTRTRQGRAAGPPAVRAVGRDPDAVTARRSYPKGHRVAGPAEAAPPRRAGWRPGRCS